jgi:peptidoglycan/LPS O-acetylase OafA/YrhL
LWRWTAIELSVTILAVVVAWKTHATPLSYGLPFVFALLVWVFARERGMVSRLLRLRPFILVGTLSYSIYMIHLFIQLRLLNMARLLDIVAGESFVRQVGRTDRYGDGIDLGSLFAGDLLIAVMVAVTIAASYMTYRLIEQPGQRLFRHLADRLFGPVGHPRDVDKRPLQPALT